MCMTTGSLTQQSRKVASNGLMIIAIIISIIGGITILKQASRKYEQDKLFYFYNIKINIFYNIRQRAYDGYRRNSITFDQYDKIDKMYADSIEVLAIKMDSIATIQKDQ